MRHMMHLMETTGVKGVLNALVNQMSACPIIIQYDE